jgi:hypothetical protein
MLLNLTQGKQVSSKIIRLNLISVQTNMINESSDSLES